MIERIKTYLKENYQSLDRVDDIYYFGKKEAFKEVIDLINKLTQIEFYLIKRFEEEAGAGLFDKEGNFVALFDEDNFQEAAFSSLVKVIDLDGSEFVEILENDDPTWEDAWKLINHPDFEEK